MLPPGNLRTWQIAGWSSLMMSSRVATKVAGRVGMVGWCGMAGFISQYTNIQSITKSIYRYIEYYHVPKPGFQTMNFQDLFFLGLNIQPLFFLVVIAPGMLYIILYVYIYINSSSAMWFWSLAHLHCPLFVEAKSAVATASKCRKPKRLQFPLWLAGCHTPVAVLDVQLYILGGLLIPRKEVQLLGG